MGEVLSCSRVASLSHSLTHSRCSVAGIWRHDFELVLSAELFFLLVYMVGWFFSFPAGFLGSPFLYDTDTTVSLFLPRLLLPLFLFLTLLLLSGALAESGMPHGASGNCHAATGLGEFLLAGTFCSCCLGATDKSTVTGGGLAGFGRWRASKTVVPRRLLACSSDCLCLFAGVARERSVSSGRVTCPFAGRRRPPDPWSPEWANGGEANGGFGRQIKVSHGCVLSWFGGIGWLGWV